MKKFYILLISIAIFSASAFFIDFAEASTLIAPANGATGVSLFPTLSWYNGYADYIQVCYRIWSSSYWSQYGWTCATAYNSYTASSLTPTTVYEWRVGDCDWSQGCYYTPSWTFTTRARPATPSFVSPVNGATNVSVPATLSWENVGAPKYIVYKFYPYTSQYIRLGTATTNSLTIELNYSTNYTWYVYACNRDAGDLCTTGVFSWYCIPNPLSECSGSTGGTFTTGAMPAPGKPVLLAPINNNVAPSLLPTFSWSPTGIYDDKTTYSVAIRKKDSGDSFTGLIGGVIPSCTFNLATSPVPVPLIGYSTYEWYVGACNGSNCASSDSGFFQTPGGGSQPPPTLVSPANGSVKVAIPGQFSWIFNGGAPTLSTALYYRPQGGTSWTSVPLSKTATSHALAVGYGTNYQWFVRVCNTGYLCTDSPIFSFTTISVAVTSNIATVNLQNNQATLKGAIVGGTSIDKIKFVWATSSEGYAYNASGPTFVWQKIFFAYLSLVKKLAWW